MKKMRNSSRIIVVLASLALGATFFLPVWFIYLIAPQYPEGLTMNIWLYQITGEVEIINGLNHYIGMKHIKAEMFPEFSFLVYIMGFFILFGLIVAATGKRNHLLAFIFTMLAGGVVAMVDFYKWGYDYGHNLDPKAAIQIPGLSYQPPLFGHKTLLNFDAYSYPDIGGWVVIGVAVILLGIWIIEWRRSRKATVVAAPVIQKSIVVAAMFGMISLTSCSTLPEPINYGKDMCSDCKMTIMDAKFGAEIITKKGKIYKFDDAHCVANFLKGGQVKSDDISQIAFVDFENNASFLNSNSLFFVVSPQFKSPMNSNAAAFPTKEKATVESAKASGEIFGWNQFYESFK